MCCFTIQYPNNAALCCWNGGSGVPNSAWYCGGVEAGGMEALCCQPVQWKRSLTHQPPLQPIPRSCTYQTRVRSHFCSLFTADIGIRACNGSQHTRSRSSFTPTTVTPLHMHTHTTLSFFFQDAPIGCGLYSNCCPVTAPVCCPTSVSGGCCPLNTHCPTAKDPPNKCVPN